MAKYTIFNTLRDDHDTIRTLQAQVADTSGNTDRRHQLWQLLKRMLLAHAQAEEEAFYSKLQQIDATRDTATHSVEEHDAIEELIQQCDHLGFDQPSWKPTFDRLVHLSNHHLDEEEVELFPLAGRVIDHALSESANDNYLTLKAHYFADLRGDPTTREGARGGTYESRSPEALRQLARQRGIQGVSDMSRSELASALRDAPSHDA